MEYSNTLLHNVSELIKDEADGGFRLMRLPSRVVSRLNPNGKNSALYTCGCEIRFNLHSERAVILLRRDRNGTDTMPYGIAEVWQGDFQGRYQLSPQVVGQDITAVTVRHMQPEKGARINGRLFDPDLYRVFVPYDWGTFIHGIEGEVSLPEKGQLPGETLLCYGSSITHGGGAAVPTGGFALKLASRLGMDLANLGLAGAAWMDDAMADYINTLKWSMAVLELGINITGWSIARFSERAEKFIKTIAEANPGKPIFCVSPFYSYFDYIKKEHMEGMRGALRLTVEKLNMPLLYYIDGSKCLDYPRGLSSDLLHPSDRGMTQISEELYSGISALLG
jgi:lysophospholipase L1-like esterase